VSGRHAGAPGGGNGSTRSRDPERAGEEAWDAAERGARRLGRDLTGGGEGEAPSRAVEVLGRVGLVAYGLVHVLVGVLAVQVAVSGGGRADQQGALTTLAAQPFGFVAIAVVVLGLVAFAVWQGLAAATGFRWVSGGDRVRKRVGAGAKTVAVLAVAAVGVRVLVTGSSGSGAAGPQEATAGLLALPAGQVLVVVLGLVVLVVAGATAYTGIARNFSDDVDYGRLPDRLRRPVEVLGVVGHVARAVAFSIVGVLFGVAALHADPREAGGLDTALRALAAQPLGPVLLLVVALGVVAFGVWSVAEAWARRV
jgi:hypothetical protein